MGLLMTPVREIFMHSSNRRKLTPPHAHAAERVNTNTYVVRQVVLESGERLPLLCEVSTGQPMAEPLLYALTDLRARGRSSATIHHAMEAIMLLLMVLSRKGIDLNGRLREGVLLDTHEIDLVVRSASERMSAYRASPDEQREADVASARNLVSRDTAAGRLLYIHSFLTWRTQFELLRMDPKGKSYEQVRRHFESVCSVLKARGPCTAARNDFGARQGLAEPDVERVVALMDASSKDVPWIMEHTKARNSLMLRWLLELGIRRGELLGVKTSDICFQQNTVLISRRADAKDDPRTRQPLTKTRARLLPISNDLADATYEYICRGRKVQTNALRHEFLFVASGSGKPLSLMAVNKVFATLRQKQPELPRDLTPHILRHTWNDRFSEAMDKAKVSEEQEKKMRSTLMGWSENSGAAATYTRRFVQRKAATALKTMQGGLHIGKSKR